MIVDDYYENGETPIIYTRHRDADGTLIENNVRDDKPYFWIPANVGEFRKRRLLVR